MLKKILNIITSNFKGYSLLRAYQIYECKNVKLKGNSIEFGAYKNKTKNFNNFLNIHSNIKLSNIYKHNDIDYIQLDLTKKLKLKKNSFDNVIIFNVLEHLPNTKNAFNQIKKILKINGVLVGSTPFIYQVHGAPNDYFRFTKDFFYGDLKKKFKKIFVKTKLNEIYPIGFFFIIKK